MPPTFGHQLRQAAQPGKITVGGATGSELGGDVDEEEAVATALQAFADGIYFVFLDDVQQEDLDAVVALQPESTLTFIRLTALAGG